MKKLVLFDLDGTLIDNPSSENRFFCWLLTHGYIGLKQFFAVLIFIVQWLPKFKRKIWVKNKAYLYDLPINKIVMLAEKFTTKQLLPLLRKRIQVRLKQHLTNGDIVILLTGSSEFIAKIFAKHLGIPKVYATKYRLKTQHFDCLPPKQHPYALEKLKIAQEICAKHGVELANTIAYANSIQDKYLLQEVGLPIVVTPDKKLKKIALAKGWEIIN